MTGPKRCVICRQPIPVRKTSCSVACRVAWRRLQNRRDPYHGEPVPWRKSTVGQRTTEAEISR